MKSKPFSEQVWALLEGVRASHENYALVRNRFFDVGIDGLAVELRFHSGQELSFTLWNSESFKSALNIGRNFFPRPLGGIPRS